MPSALVGLIVETHQLAPKRSHYPFLLLTWALHRCTVLTNRQHAVSPQACAPQQKLPNSSTRQTACWPVALTPGAMRRNYHRAGQGRTPLGDFQENAGKMCFAGPAMLDAGGLQADSSSSAQAVWKASRMLRWEKPRCWRKRICLARVSASSGGAAYLRRST